jgi:hypothetical protein
LYKWEDGEIMRNKWIVCILIVTLMWPFAVNNSTAGGGGSCSGEDENQCLAVVFGTAAVLVIGVYVLTKLADGGKPVASEKEPFEKKAFPNNNQVDPLAEKHVTALAFEIEDKVAQNGDVIIWKW